jgi:hypothetical protein
MEAHSSSDQAQGTVFSILLEDAGEIPSIFLTLSLTSYKIER